MLRAPVFALSMVTATLYAALFHLLWGETLKELLISWLAAVGGLLAGQVLARVFGWPDLRIGELRFLTATLSSWLSMAFVRRLGL